MPPYRDPILRFWEKVNKTDTCWLWTAEQNGHGYGMFWDGRKKVSTHRWSYQYFTGPIPEGLELDHLCRVRHCVNPDHLEPVTRFENVRRGLQGAINAAKTHCKSGHEFIPENTLLYRGSRHCVECKRIRSAESEKHRPKRVWNPAYDRKRLERRRAETAARRAA